MLKQHFPSVRASNKIRIQLWTILLVLITLIAFAANSILCRLALSAQLIDPISFTSIRLSSGAIMLLIMILVSGKNFSTISKNSNWKSALALFSYAFAFSVAYLSLSTGMGALILFGSVQITMMASALYGGEKLKILQWIGFFTALAGFIYLVLPGISAPDPLGAGLMAASGIAWGIYSIRGKRASFPVLMTTGNFVLAALPAVVINLITLNFSHIEFKGAILATTSGALTSGLGYVLWYKALRFITTSQASIIQLTVPIIAAFGGIIFLAEIISLRLIVATILILGGIGMALISRKSR